MSSHIVSVRSALALLVLALSVADGVAEPGKRQTPASPSARDHATIRIDNFGRVNANYYRGAEPDDSQYPTLAAFGIKLVIDLRGNDIDPNDRLRAEREGMKYVHIAMNSRESPTNAMIERFLQLVDQPEHHPVYVHCVGGKHRTGVMTAIYRMAREGWTAQQAYKEMKAYKFGPDFLHPEFKKFVFAYRPGGVADKPDE